jgi:hypothetical protein
VAHCGLASSLGGRVQEALGHYDLLILFWDLQKVGPAPLGFPLAVTSILQQQKKKKKSNGRDSLPPPSPQNQCIHKACLPSLILIFPRSCVDFETSVLFCHKQNLIAELIPQIDFGGRALIISLNLSSMLNCAAV